MGIKKLLNCFRQLSSQGKVANICIVGSGPAGFYTAQQILKTCNNVRIDILEKLPVPYGLVRYGVAPDHPEVKNVIHTFEKIAKDPRIEFFGNVHVGKDVSVQQLRQFYHAVLLSYGADEDRTLNIEGENLPNVISARRFVGWYNGLPYDKNLEIDLSAEDVVVLGQGNVGIDVARILLSPIDKLKNTDITSYCLEKLSTSKICRVWFVGRRGPLQAAFTIAELREILRLEGCKTIWREEDFQGIKEILPQLVRPRKRLTELMVKSLEESHLNIGKTKKEFRPIFLRSPVLFSGTTKLKGVKFSVNKLEGDDVLKKHAVPTSSFEEIPCELAVRSIGYKSIQIDPDIPFNSKEGKVINSLGKIDSSFYAAGWLATGPVGVILSTMNNAFQVGKMLTSEINSEVDRLGSIDLNKVLKNKGIQRVSFSDWEKIDKEECRRGKELNKPREKIVDISEMLNIIK